MEQDKGRVRLCKMNICTYVYLYRKYWLDMENLLLRFTPHNDSKLNKIQTCASREGNLQSDPKMLFLCYVFCEGDLPSLPAFGC